MKKAIFLLGACGLLGGCMATVSPRGDVEVSYVPPVYEEIYVSSAPRYVSVVTAPRPRPVYVAPFRPVHIARPRPPRPVIVHPRPHMGGGHPGVGPGHPGHGNGGNHGPSHPGHGHGSNHGPSHPGHGHGGNHGPSNPGPSGNGGGGHAPQPPATPRPDMSQLRINR